VQQDALEAGGVGVDTCFSSMANKKTRERERTIPIISNTSRRPANVDSVDEKENNPRAVCPGPHSHVKPPQPPSNSRPHEHRGEGVHVKMAHAKARVSSGQGRGVSAKQSDKDALVPATKSAGPRLGSRATSDPARSTEHGSSSSSNHGAPTRRDPQQMSGNGLTLVVNANKGRLASTVPTRALERPVSDDDKKRIHSVHSVPQLVQPAARRARSADDPPAGNADTDDDGEEWRQREEGGGARRQRRLVQWTWLRYSGRL
jgi:hypothetical protein